MTEYLSMLWTVLMPVHGQDFMVHTLADGWDFLRHWSSGDQIKECNRILSKY